MKSSIAGTITTFTLPQTSIASDLYVQNENTTEDTLVLTENYRPISPPAEYASGSTKKILPTLPTVPVPPSPKTRAVIGSRLANKSNKRSSLRYNYQRSRSHCHEMPTEDSNQVVYGTREQKSAFNINSHKSLPDLHSQICRHSPHSEVFSCCSRGNKSIKSVGAESSLNRDSGSSGHYTHRSEPCYRMYESGDSSSNNNQQGSQHLNKNMGYNNGSDYRRDSGSSTQHTPLSYGGYITTSPMSSPYHDYLRSAIDCTQCLAKQQFQLQQQQQQQQSHGYPCSADSNTKSDILSDYRGNYATLEVPTAFQDDYKPLLSPPSYAKSYKPTSSNNNGHQSPCHQYATSVCYPIHLNKQQQQQQQQQQLYQQNQRYHQQKQQQQQQQQQQHINAYRQHQLLQKQQQQQLQQLQHQQSMEYLSMVNSPTSVQLTAEDISPPAIQFKRQKCIRFKNRHQRYGFVEHSCGMEPLLLPPPTPPPSAELCENIFSCSLDQQQSPQQYFNFPKCYPNEARRLSQGYIDSNQGISRYGDISSPPRQIWPPLPVRDYEPMNADFGAVSDNVLELERFFDRLGLNDESFYEIYVLNKKRNGSGSDSDNSSTVFFSDVSTVDSMRLPDSSESQVSTPQPYRPTEPLSIVERNARIIKWLCNIRKAQNT